MDNERQSIINSMEPLYRSAETNNLWFHCAYQDLWFTPKELRESQAKGSFCWGPDNWTLRDPGEQRKYLLSKIVSANTELESFNKRIK